MQRKKVDGKKLGLDWDHIEDSSNHRQRDYDLGLEMAELQDELQSAIRNDRWSKQRRLRRRINQILEEKLSLHVRWCSGCQNVFHNCSCPLVKEA